MCEGGSVVDSYDDLYFDGAPVDSIAAGADYGRMPDAFDDPSPSEKLLIGRGRVYNQIIKIVATGRHDGAVKLVGSSIFFMHDLQSHEGGGGAKRAEDIAESELSEASIVAALSSLQILLVGPHGRWGALEKSAHELCKRVLLNRAHVVYNFLQLRHVLQGGPAPPPTGRMKELMATANRAVARHRYAETETFEADHSDVANVRASSSSSSANATAMGESERSNSAASATDVDVSESVAVFGKAVQGMGAIVKSVAAAVGRARTAEGCDADDSGRAGEGEGPDGLQVPPQVPPQQQQGADRHEHDSTRDQRHDPQQHDPQQHDPQQQQHRSQQP